MYWDKRGRRVAAGKRYERGLTGEAGHGVPGVLLPSQTRAKVLHLVQGEVGITMPSLLFAGRALTLKLRNYLSSLSLTASTASSALSATFSATSLALS